MLIYIYIHHLIIAFIPIMILWFALRVEIRIQFHHVPGNIYRERIGQNIDLATNELILRDHPDEAILLKVNNKVPGLGLQLDASELNLLYRDKYGSMTLVYISKVVCVYPWTYNGMDLGFVGTMLKCQILMNTSFWMWLMETTIFSWGVMNWQLHGIYLLQFFMKLMKIK